MWEEEDVEVRMCGGREGEIGLDWMGGVGVEEQGARVGCTYPGWGCGAQNSVHTWGLHRVGGVNVHRDQGAHTWVMRQDLQTNLTSRFPICNCVTLHTKH